MWKNIEISPKEYERTLNWPDAMMYCQLLVIDDKNDWRLPSIEELYEIYNSENDFVGFYYWSSTESIRHIWIQDMSNGYQNNYYKNNSFYVRAVRTI